MPRKPIKIRMRDTLRGFLTDTTALDLMPAHLTNPPKRIAPLAATDDDFPPPPKPQPEPPERGPRIVFPVVHTGTLVALIKANMERGGEPLDGYCDYLPGRSDMLVTELAKEQIWSGTKVSHVAHARGAWVGKVQRPALPEPPKPPKVEASDVEQLKTLVLNLAAEVASLSERLKTLEVFLEA